ncbi:MAG: PKD domain-containing protein [Burkholderiaceae bacterium]|nr:PKD domain-containing protein [Burkholderiaceae bacterium]
MRFAGLMARAARWLGLGAAVLALAACGGGGSGCVDVFGGNACGDAGGGGGGTPVQALTLNLQLLDGDGKATTSVVVGQPLRATAVLRLDGQAVSGEIVQFGIEQSADLVKIDPVTGSQLTDAGGAASVTVNSLGSATGAGRITAVARIGELEATAAANFFTTGGTTPQPATLVLGNVSIEPGSVSAYGTAGIRVQVLQGGQPYTGGPVEVGFSSSCAAGKATITESATTRPDGTAEATFVDNGCAQTADTAVTITATIGTDTESGTLQVKSPTTGSLRFVSAVPADKSITLRGQGGIGRQENATLTFQLVDVAGQGVADADVCFDASTYIGSLNIDGFDPDKKPVPQGSEALCGSDNLSIVRYVKRTNADGTVTVQVNSGTVPTPVRVRARALYPSGATSALQTFSDTLSISTGLPLQRSFSLSVDKANIDGGNFDGEIATVTVRLADQFSNPVPDGTVVSFIGSGASVCTADNGSCKTVNGACSCQVVSQERRPLDNRVIVTAYAVGLEDFDDVDGDNLYKAGVDPFHDLGDAFVDANKDGLAADGGATGAFNPTKSGDTDILIPFRQELGFRRDGDGARDLAHIRASTVIYLSLSSSGGDPTVVVPLSELSQERDLVDGDRIGDYFLRLRPGCPQGVPVPQAALSMLLDDGIGNPMAAGTDLLPIDASDNITTGGFRPSSVLAVGARPPSPLFDLPNVPKHWPDATGMFPTGHGITVRGVQDKCSGDASFALQVTSPRGGAAVARVLFQGESRAGGRGGFPVRYRDAGVAFEVQATGGANEFELDPISLTGSAGGATPASVEVDWGDGTVQAYVAPGFAAPAGYVHAYAGPGEYRVRVTVQPGNVSATKTVSVP